MSNISELKDIIDKGDASALTTTGAIFGTLADISGGIGFVQLAIGAIEGLISQDDSLQQILGTIQAAFTELQAQISASDKLQRMRDVDQGINPAMAVFEQLPAILAAEPPPSQDFKLTQIQTCIEAVLFFADYEDKWQAVKTDLRYYSDSWSGDMSPQAGEDGLVFDYVYTLPQFLRAIYILLTAIGALEPTSLQYYSDVLERCLSRLESVHQTIVTSGIVPMKTPRPLDIGMITVEPIPSFTSNWLIDTDRLNPFYYPYGAVEVYSGSYILRSYATDAFNYWGADLSTWWLPNANNFMTLLDFRQIKKMKELYTQIGMPTVYNVTNQLRQLLGQPPQAQPIYSAWSFAEVESLLGLTLPPLSWRSLAARLLGLEPQGLEAALRSFLELTPPYVSFFVFGTNSDDPTFVADSQTVALLPIPLPSGSLYTFLTGVSSQPKLFRRTA